jgi:hypothetical protein
MAKVSATYGGFLNAETTKEAGLVGEKLLIKSADEFKFDDGSRKIVVEFDGDGYKLALNVTNANILAEAFGDESTAWEGEEVTLAIEKVKFGKKMVPGVRVKPLNPQVKPETVG